jgi:zinc/manganese transport system substrate-binding protein
MKHRHFIWALVFLLNVTSGWAQLVHPVRLGTPFPPGHRLHVVTSFPPLYCFAVNIAGDVATVDNLLPPGAEPHDFQFSPREMRQIQSADLVVVNGLGLESWLDRVMNSIPNSQNVVVAATTGLTTSELIPLAPDLEHPNRNPSSTNALNPHTWLDPQLAEEAVANILLAMSRADPTNAATYAKNAAVYIARLQKLDATMQSELAPFKGQAIVTFHDAFPYLARRYGLKVAGVVERVPEVEPSPRYLEALHRAMDTNHVKAIFAEPQGSQKLANQIGADYHVAVGKLDTLETAELKPTAYEDGMRANLAALETFLK